MAASYPATIRRFTAKHNVSDVNFADDVNALQDEVTAIQQALGITPYGSYTDVFSRLNGVDASLSNKAALNHTHSGSTAAPAVPLDGSVAMTGVLTLPSTNPTNSNHATRKAYVDSAISGAINNHWIPATGVTAGLVGGTPGLGQLQIQAGDSLATVDNFGNAAVSFPTSFPNGVLVVIPVGGDAGTWSSAASIVNCTKSQFSFHAAGMANFTLRVLWIAIGF